MRTIRRYVAVDRWEDADVPPPDPAETVRGWLERTLDVPLEHAFVWIDAEVSCFRSLAQSLAADAFRESRDLPAQVATRVARGALGAAVSFVTDRVSFAQFSEALHGISPAPKRARTALGVGGGAVVEHPFEYAGLGVLRNPAAHVPSDTELRVCDVRAEFLCLATARDVFQVQRAPWAETSAMFFGGIPPPPPAARVFRPIPGPARGIAELAHQVAAFLDADPTNRASLRDAFSNDTQSLYVERIGMFVAPPAVHPAHVRVDSMFAVDAWVPRDVTGLVGDGLLGAAFARLPLENPLRFTALAVRASRRVTLRHADHGPQAPADQAERVWSVIRAAVVLHASARISRNGGDRRITRWSECLCIGVPAGSSLAYHCVFSTGTQYFFFESREGKWTASVADVLGAMRHVNAFLDTVNKTLRLSPSAALLSLPCETDELDDVTNACDSRLPYVITSLYAFRSLTIDVRADVVRANHRTEANGVFETSASGDAAAGRFATVLQNLKHPTYAPAMRSDESALQTTAVSNREATVTVQLLRKEARVSFARMRSVRAANKILWPIALFQMLSPRPLSAAASYSPAGPSTADPADDPSEDEVDVMELVQSFVDTPQSGGSASAAARRKLNFKKMLFAADKHMFDFRLNSKSYFSYCQANVSRIPVVITRAQKERIDREFPNAYTGAFQAGSTEDKRKQNFYICPQFWCATENVAMSEDDVRANDGLCPGKVREAPFDLRGKKHGYFHRNGKYVERFAGPLKVLHPDGYEMPCCFIKSAADETPKKKSAYARSYSSHHTLLPGQLTALPDRVSALLGVRSAAGAVGKSQATPPILVFHGDVKAAIHAALRRGDEPPPPGFLFGAAGGALFRELTQSTATTSAAAARAWLERNPDVRALCLDAEHDDAVLRVVCSAHERWGGRAESPILDVEVQRDLAAWPVHVLRITDSGAVRVLAEPAIGDPQPPRPAEWSARRDPVVLVDDRAGAFHVRWPTGMRASPIGASKSPIGAGGKSRALDVALELRGTPVRSYDMRVTGVLTRAGVLVPIVPPADPRDPAVAGEPFVFEGSVQRRMTRRVPYETARRILEHVRRKSGDDGYRVEATLQSSPSAKDALKLENGSHVPLAHKGAIVDSVYFDRARVARSIFVRESPDVHSDLVVAHQARLREAHRVHGQIAERLVDDPDLARRVRALRSRENPWPRAVRLDHVLREVDDDADLPTRMRVARILFHEGAAGLVRAWFSMHVVRADETLTAVDVDSDFTRIGPRRPDPRVSS